MDTAKVMKSFVYALNAALLGLGISMEDLREFLKLC